MNNTDSRINLQSAGFPVAIRESDHEDVWNSIRAEQEEIEVFEMGDRDYKVLQAPSGTIELGGLVYRIVSLPTREFWHVGTNFYFYNKFLNIITFRYW